MFPNMASSISELVGCGLLASSAAADMIWPDWQYPHCGTSRSSQAFWILAPTAVAPIASIVVISDVPMLSIGVMQERMAVPSIVTVRCECFELGNQFVCNNVIRVKRKHPGRRNPGFL